MREFDFNTEQCIKNRFPLACFKGGGGSGGPPKPRLSEHGKWAESKMYPHATRAMQGGGLLPGMLQQKILDTSTEGLQSAYDSAYNTLNRNLAPAKRRGDQKVVSESRDAMAYAYDQAKDQIFRDERQQKAQDVQMGEALATQWLSGAKQMGVNLLDQYNRHQAQMYENRQQYGTFTSNLAQGLGNMGGSMVAADMYAKEFNSR